MENNQSFDETLAQLEPLFAKLLNYLDVGEIAKPPFDKRDYATGFTLIYKLCINSNDAGNTTNAKLYELHKERIENYLSTRVVPSIESIKSSKNFLQEFVKRWKMFLILNRWMENFFSYLGRYYIKELKTERKELSQRGLDAFRSAVFEQVREKVTKEVLEMVSQERNGEQIDTTLLKHCVEVYKLLESENLSLYQMHFEAQFLENSKEFYSRKAQEWISMDNTSQYLFKSEKAIEKEMSQVRELMSETTSPKIQQVCADVLLGEQENTLLHMENSGLVSMLRDDKREDLGRAFRMFSLVANGLDPVSQMLREHIIQEGKVILGKREAELAASDGKDSASDAVFIQSLLDLHSRYQGLVATEFENHNQFQTALKYAFENTVNTDFGKHSNAELLSTHADSVLKAGGDERRSDSEIEEVLEKVVSIFSFLNDKDVFAEVYRNHLAKRLLNQKSTSVFAEQSMISKLKLKCGAYFTSKLEGMMNDEKLAKDTESKFNTFITKDCPDEEKSPIEFSCSVLTTGHWPTYKILEPILPPAFEKCVNVFTQFYAKDTDHRKLTWVYALGTATVKGKFKNAYDFQVVTIQAFAMLLFNDVPEDGELTFHEVASRLKLDIEVTKRVLHSLSCQKLHVLNKSPESKKIDENDKFCVNKAFASKIRKVKIAMASLEDSHNPKRVEEDRGFAIEAAIVRIMKARKRLVHQTLMTEVMNQLHLFRPDPKTIKKKIEALIEREYLERDEDEQNFYKYRA